MSIGPLPKELLRRFEVFVQTLEGYENVDELLRHQEPHGRKRADYLFEGRTIIVEQKELAIDPADRPQKFIEKIIHERGIIFWGTLSSKAIFSKLPDGEELQRRMVLDIAKVIDGDVANADKQARGTREIFGIT